MRAAFRVNGVLQEREQFFDRSESLRQRGHNRELLTCKLNARDNPATYGNCHVGKVLLGTEAGPRARVVVVRDAGTLPTALMPQESCLNRVRLAHRRSRR